MSCRHLFGGISAVVVGLFSIGSAHGQIFASNISNNTIGEYDAVTGMTINSSFISTGTNTPLGIAISGNSFFVTNYDNGTIGLYNATTGAPINTSFISTGLSYPDAIAISGNKLYVSNGGDKGSGVGIGVYDATTGAAINASLIVPGAGLGPGGANGLAISGNKLFLTDGDLDTIGVFDATTGAAINSSLASGLNGPVGLTISGNSLYVGIVGSQHTIRQIDATTGATINTFNSAGFAGLALSGNNLFDNTGSEYDATTGAVINANFFSPSGTTWDVIYQAESVPEPSTWAPLLVGITALVFWRRRFAARTDIWVGE